MRLIRQYVLQFSTGNQGKAKVFEVDLCGVGAGRFVVNYRYGRSGHVLRDGTRTLSPVSADAADRELEQLLNEKLRSGYQITAQYPPPPAASPSPPSPTTTAVSAATAAGQAMAPTGHHQVSPLWQHRSMTPLDVGEAAVLSWLHRHRHSPPSSASSEGGEGVWPLARVAWRAGELRLGAAVPLLLGLRHRSPGEDYAIAWALGRCGGSASVGGLESYLDHPSPSVGRIARAGLSLLLEGGGLLALRARLKNELPPWLLTAAGEEERRAVLLGWPGDAREALARVYLLGDVRTARERLAVLSLSSAEGVGEARTLQQLAEHADDLPTFVAASARLEEDAAAVGGLGTTAGGARRLRSRCWRVLHQRHADQDPGWRPLALALLLAFDDVRHPHAADPRRRLHRELADALPLLIPTWTAPERDALVAAPCGWVSSLARGVS